MIRPSRALIIERTTCLVSTIGEMVLSRTSDSSRSSRIIASTPEVPRPALFTSP